MQSVNQGTLIKTKNQLDLNINRDANNRIFVNKSLRLGDMKCFGFDMDYTLAEYRSPDFEVMVYELLVERMVALGYPKELENIKYDPSFPIRGLWVDKKLGNLLKTDNNGNIFLAFHGFRKICNTEIIDQYPNRCIQYESSRVMTTDTCYSLPEIFLIAATISYLESIESCIRGDTGITLNGNSINYSAILKDIRDSMDYVHVTDNKLKQNILNNLQKYVKRSRRLPEMILELRSQEVKTFLLTNSDFEYTKTICQFIFFCSDDNSDQWKTFFDYIIVNGKKPLFFLGGTVMRRVNESSTPSKLEEYTGPMESGCVYSGGSADLFSQLTKISGKHILYFGDHIYGDVVVSKKVTWWNTCLIVPEIENEFIDGECKYLLDKIAKFSSKSDLGSKSTSKFNIVLRRISDISKCIGKRHGRFGSLFRCGDRLTFFAEQLGTYADIYTSTCLNLIYYPTSHVFRSPFLSMSHEVVDSENRE